MRARIRKQVYNKHQPDGAEASGALLVGGEDVHAAVRYQQRVLPLR